MIKLKKGLNLPIEGEPNQVIENGPEVTKVALVGDDVVGMKPTMLVKVGDKVKKGQVIYTDKKTEGVKYTAPASGEVVELNRGEKRVFQSLVIKVEGDDHVDFSAYKGADLSSYDEEAMKNLLIESGSWPSVRRRPFSKVADPIDGVEKKEFSGPHPAGLVGTHIHFVDPVGEKKFVWHMGYQDVIAIGHLVKTGKLYTKRIIAVAGPEAKNPRLITTRLGANLSEVLKDEVKSENVRFLSSNG